MSIQSEINRLKNNVAATYAAMEEQGATMPTQQNSANMAATARTIPTGSGGGTTVQADWAVNNPTKAAYVKNRTHWKEVFDGPEGEVISETEVSFTSNIKTVTGAMADGIQVGGLYVVRWNGTDYECVGKSGSDGNYIGNGSFMNAGSITFEDTGEPFCVLLFGGTYYQLWKADTTAETVTVKVVGEKVVIWHKLEGGYLPEGVPYVETNVVEILPETTAAVDPDMGGAMLPDVLDVVSGNDYTINYNGTEYVCTALSFSPEEGVMTVVLGDLGAMTGGVSTGEPFVVLCLDAATAAEMGAGVQIAPLDGAESVTLSISSGSRTVHKISNELLPEGIPYAEPFDDVIMSEWPTNTLPSGDNSFYFADSVGKLIEGNVYKVNWGGTVYECVARYDSNGNKYVLGSGDNGIGDGIVTDHPFAVVILAVPVDLGDGTMVTGGIYTYSPRENGEFSVTGSLNVQKIDEHCLPDNLMPLVVHVKKTGGTWTSDIHPGFVSEEVRKGRKLQAYVYDGDNDIWSVLDLTKKHQSDLIFSAVLFDGTNTVLDQIVLDINTNEITRTKKTLTTT